MGYIIELKNTSTGKIKYVVRATAEREKVLAYTLDGQKPTVWKTLAGARRALTKPAPNYIKRQGCNGSTMEKYLLWLGYEVSNFIEVHENG